MAFLGLEQQRGEIWMESGFFFFLFCPSAHGISVPRQGIEPAPPAVRSPNRWTAREFPELGFILKVNSTELSDELFCTDTSIYIYIFLIFIGV